MVQGTLGPSKAPLSGRLLFLPARSLAGLGSIALLAAWLAANHYPPWTSFHGEAAAFFALCCFGLARVLTIDFHRLRFPAIAAVPLFLLMVVGAQWLFGLIAYGGDAFLSGLYLFGSTVALWLGSTAQEDEKPDLLTWLAGLVLAGAAASVFIGVLQWHRLEQSLGVFAAERGPDLRVYANLGQPNHLGTLCLLGVVMTLWLRHANVLRPWQLVVATIWLSLGTVLTESRSALLGAMVVGLLLLSGRRHLHQARAFVGCWWGGLVLGHLALAKLNNFLYLDPVRSVKLGDDNQRGIMWRQAVTAIADAPWLGHGWRQSMTALKQAAAEVPGQLATDYAHNIILDLMVWVGVPTGLLLALAFTAWLWRTLHRISDTRSLLLLAALVPVLVHSLFEFPFAYAYFLFPAAFLIGASSARHALSARVILLRRGGAIVVLCVFAALSFAVASEYIQAEDDYRVMRFELRKVGRVPQGHQTPELMFLTQLQDLLVYGRLEPKAGLSADALRGLGIASAHNGWATLDLTYAAALGMNGQAEEAERQLRHLQNVYGRKSAEQAYALFRAYQATHPELAAVRLP